MMAALANYLRRDALFVGLSLLFILCGTVAMLSVPKGELHLMLCAHHAPWADLLMDYASRAAGWLPYILTLGLLFYKYGWAAFMAGAVSISGLVTQIIKHIVHAPRPLTWFAQHYPDIQLPLVDGVRMAHWYSFPSGHTTNFFASFFVLSLVISCGVQNRPLRLAAQGLCFVLAALGGYSRIYLSMHFMLDVVTGAAIGMLTVALLLPLAAAGEQRRWWNLNLLSLFPKKCK